MSKGKWYKKYVQEQFSSIKKVEGIRQESLRLQAKEYKRRLEDLNGEAARLRSIQATYIPREVFENSVKSVLDKTEAAAKAIEGKHQDLIDKTIAPMLTYQNKLQGKIAIIVIIGGAIWGVIVGLMFYFLNKINF